MASDKMEKFDWSIKQRLSDLLQKTRLFQLDDELHTQFSFACVIQDRLKDAIEYLDTHLEAPRHRNELYLFMVYADNVFSAVQEFFKLPLIKHKVENPYDDKTRKGEDFRFFKATFKVAFPHTSEDKIPTDDDFFKYFRALSFAHPYETSRQKFIDKKGGEIHYSPFPLVRSDTEFPVGADGDIGVAVYSNGLGEHKTPTYFNITLQCSTIKDFLISRYNTLSNVIDFLEKLLGEKQRVLNEFRVNRNKTVGEVLLQIKENLEMRKLDLNDITELIELWKGDYSSNSQKNEEAIKLYKEALQNRMEELCDAMDEANIDKVYGIMNELLRANLPDDPSQPENGYRNLNYYYGNVVRICTSKEENKEFLKKNLSYLMDGYAQKWVEMDADSMPNDVILKLLTIARFLEANSLSQKPEFNGF